MKPPLEERIHKLGIRREIGDRDGFGVSDARSRAVRSEGKRGYLEAWAGALL